MKNTVTRSIPMAAALAAALLMGGAAFAQGANGSSTDATNANAAQMAKDPMAKPMPPAPMAKPAAAAPISNAASPGSIQPSDPMAGPKPKMSAKERADRKAERKAMKAAKPAAAKDAMLSNSTGMPAKP